MKHTVKGEETRKCENCSFLKIFDLNPELSGLDFHLYFIQGHKHAGERAAQKETGADTQHLCTRGCSSSVAQFSPFRSPALTVTVSAISCSWPGKTDLGRMHNTRSCNPIWPPSYSSLVHEGGSLDFSDQIRQDISTCIWPSTWKANHRSSEILSESRASSAERGRANLVAHSQAPQASAFACQAWLISCSTVAGRDEQFLNHEKFFPS